MRNNFVIIAIILGMFVFTSTPAHAEWYVGGQVGFVKPNNLKNVNGVGPAKGLEISNVDLKNGLGYGMKPGYFFTDYMNWLGLESEVFTANPLVKQQNITAKIDGSSASLGTVPGRHLPIITPAVNLMFRVPNYYVEPYVGAGSSVIPTRTSNSDGSDNDITPSGNAFLGGFRYYLNNKVAMFTEYTYNYTKFTFTPSRIKETFFSHGVFGGFSFHF